MRIITNSINPIILFWYAVYALAVLLFLVGGIVVGNQDSNRVTQKIR